jgi:glycerol-3-phosphate acyltransferase PlsY
MSVSLLGVLGYFIGSIPFALLLARRWGTSDLRRVGSGNIGATNVLRVSGVRAGLLVALLDISKGAISVFVAQGLSGGGGAAPAVAGLAAVVGHVYPVWLKFKGGKGVATACGAFAVLMPAAMPPALAIFLAGTWMTRHVSVGSMAATAALPPIAYATSSPAPVVAAACGAAALVLFRHRSNFSRLRAGSEPRLQDH